MARVKINQKISLPEFKTMMEQRKVNQIHVVLGSDLPVTKDRVLGRVTSAFNLGKKIEVDMELYGIQDKTVKQKPVDGVFWFENLDSVYYLVKKDD